MPPAGGCVGRRHFTTALLPGRATEVQHRPPTALTRTGMRPAGPRSYRSTTPNPGRCQFRSHRCCPRYLRSRRWGRHRLIRERAIDDLAQSRGRILGRCLSMALEGSAGWRAQNGVRWTALRRRNAESQNIAKLAVNAGLKIAPYFGAYWLLIDAEYPAMVYFNSRSKRGIRG